MKSVLELTIFIFLSQVSLRSLCAYFVRQTEPKILRLVSLSNDAISVYFSPPGSLVVLAWV